MDKTCFYGILALLAVRLASGDQAKGCQEGFKYPSPDSCGKFLICRNGTLVTQDCPKAQLFDSNTTLCKDWREVSCSNGETYYPQMGEDCGGASYRWPVDEDCKKFAECSPEAKQTQGSCWWGTKFDPSRRTCWIGFMVDCEAAWKTRCREGTRKDVNGRPQEFRQCTRGEWVVFACPEGMSYSYIDHRCESQDVVANQTDTNCPDGERYPVDKSCKRYMICDRNTGEVTEGSCRWCQNFDPKTAKCSWAWSYRCVEPTTAAPATTAKPTEAPATTAKPTEAPATTAKPTEAPATTAKPTEAPATTAKPTEAPATTAKPTEAPATTAKPTEAPATTVKPTEAPATTAKPTEGPTTKAKLCTEGEKIPVDCKNYKLCKNDAWVDQKCSFVKKFDRKSLKCVYWGATC